MTRAKRRAFVGDHHLEEKKKLDLRPMTRAREEQVPLV